MFNDEEQTFEPLDLSTVEHPVEKIFKDLNPQQAAAVNCTEGPLLIMAGAGSGKTKVLTCRIANLLAKGISPWKILAITFTNKAANEMKTRAEKLIGAPAQNVWLSTFHSFCAKILRYEIEVTGVYKKNFVIYDAGDSQALIKECVKQLNLDTEKFSNVSNRISDAKNRLEDAAHYREYISRRATISDFDRNVVAIYELYEKKLIENNALDFDDLIMVTVKMFRDYDSVREKYQEKFQYILIDEYQDTNMAQYILTKYLAGKHQNICVVGDADQSIYGWRGADMRNILNFEHDYPDAKIITLEQNYRSTRQILAAANALIKNNLNRKEKNLWTENEQGEKIKFIHCLSDRSEAAFVAKEIRRLVSKENYRYKDIAILYRTNAQSQVLEEKFIQSEIPYVIIGGLKFYDRKEIKDILAYLRLVLNPYDHISLLRVVNVPRRGLGPINMNRLLTFAEMRDIPLFEIMVNPDILYSVPQLSPKAKQTLQEFAALILSFSSPGKYPKLVDLVNAVLDKTGYLQSLKEGEDGKKPENIARVENLGAFVNSAAEFEELNPDATLEDFLNHVALMTDLDSFDEEESRVSMMTVHSAKGLEFPAVFVTGVEEGLFPHSNSLMEMDKLEEERRACYVAITRAQKLLYITAACERKTFGRSYDASISRFIKEIPPDCMDSFSENHSGGALYGKSAAALRAHNLYLKERGFSLPTAHKEAKVILPSPKKEIRPAIDWKVGDKASHKKWGVGTIMEINGDSLTIQFANPEYGHKILKAGRAPIEKV